MSELRGKKLLDFKSVENLNHRSSNLPFQETHQQPTFENIRDKNLRRKQNNNIKMIVNRLFFRTLSESWKKSWIQVGVCWNNKWKKNITYDYNLNVAIIVSPNYNHKSLISTNKITRKKM